MTQKSLWAALFATACAFTFSPAASQAGGHDERCSNRSNNNIEKLLQCMDVENVRAHQQALQEIADANGGNRFSGTAGFDESVDYVVQTLEAAGYSPVVQEFLYDVFLETAAATLSQTAPETLDYEYLTDFFTMSYSGSTGGVPVVGPVEAVDLDLGLGNSSTSGCEADDFAGFTPGSIALMQRGACTFALKAENAADAGAIGAIIFNQGNAPGRDVLFGGTLGAGFSGRIPVVSMTYDLGEALSGIAGLELALATTTVSLENTPTYNILAETKFGADDNVVMVGAHLDSVFPGPGIQDNGSGSAAILETAVQLANTPTKNKIRFAWWGAEESGLIGSIFYVNDLIEQKEAGESDAIDDIAMYLNFDMIGSPNYVFKIYDGDDSDGVGAPAGPPGSDAIEKFFENFYDALGEPYKGTDFSGRSDYGPFIAEGVDIPSGGLFTGAEELKTEEEAAIWGGTVGDQLDPCYHIACDTFDNINLKAYDVNSQAVAASTLYFAQNTSEVNGAKAKGNFKTTEKALRKIEHGDLEQVGHLFTK